MSNENNSFQKVFDELLPLELKQMVFKWAATDNNSEVQISLFHDNEDRLNAPAVDLLAKLKQQYSAKVYTQALQYLTGPLFRWVFISDTQPHRYLLAAFRRSVPMEVRERIEHAYLPRVTVNGLIDPTTLSTSLESLQTMLRHSDYFTRLLRSGSGNHGDDTHLVRKTKQDISGGILLLPSTLPWLKKLDLSLDIIDCLDGKPEQSESVLRRYYQGSREILACSPLPAGLGVLVNLKGIASLDIRVIWDDFLKKEQNFKRRGTEKKLRESFIKALHLSVPARSVVSYPDN